MKIDFTHSKEILKMYWIYCSNFTIQSFNSDQNFKESHDKYQI